MLQEFNAQSLVQMSALDDSREICEEDLGIIHKLRIANIRPEGREGVVANFGKSAGQL